MDDLKDTSAHRRHATIGPRQQYLQMCLGGGTNVLLKSLMGKILVEKSSRKDSPIHRRSENIVLPNLNKFLL
jgi:hypothetical protein